MKADVGPKHPAPGEAAAGRFRPEALVNAGSPPAAVIASTPAPSKGRWQVRAQVDLLARKHSPTCTRIREGGALAFLACSDSSSESSAAAAEPVGTAARGAEAAAKSTSRLPAVLRAEGCWWSQACHVTHRLTHRLHSIFATACFAAAWSKANSNVQYHKRQSLKKPLLTMNVLCEL